MIGVKTSNPQFKWMAKSKLLRWVEEFTLSKVHETNQIMRHRVFFSRGVRFVKIRQHHPEIGNAVNLRTGQLALTFPKKGALGRVRGC